MRTAATVFVALLVLAVPASAQDLDGGWIRGSCDRCRMISYVDAPGWSGLSKAPQRVSQRDGFWLQGWGFICEGGGTPDQVRVRWQDDEGYWPFLPQAVGSLYVEQCRPDVRAVFAPYCPGLADNTGWRLHVTKLPPLGVRNIIIQVHRGPYFETHYRTVIVVP